MTYFFDQPKIQKGDIKISHAVTEFYNQHCDMRFLYIMCKPELEQLTKKQYCLFNFITNEFSLQHVRHRFVLLQIVKLLYPDIIIIYIIIRKFI